MGNHDKRQSTVEPIKLQGFQMCPVLTHYNICKLAAYISQHSMKTSKYFTWHNAVLTGGSQQTIKRQESPN